MTTLPDALAAYGSAGFEQVLKRELQGLGGGVLPLAAGTSQGGQVDDADLGVTVLQVAEEDDSLAVKVGVFFNEIVGGCSCGDDPFRENAYCELLVHIDRHTAAVRFEVPAR